jgi:hypothetical protein
MLKNETRKGLELFVIRANELRASTFIELLKQGEGFRVRLTLGPEGGAIETIGPEHDSDEVANFARRLRQFLLRGKENDRFAFDVLQRCLNDAGLSQTWKQGFIEARKVLDQFLKATPRIELLHPVTRQCLISTNEDALNLFFYGTLFHTTRWDELEELRARIGAVLFADHLFKQALIGVYQIIIYVADLTEQELARHSSQSA